MRKGLTIGIIALALGLWGFVGPLPAANADLGAFEQYKNQMSAVQRTMAELGLLQKWSLTGAAGEVQLVVTSDGQRQIYANGNLIRVDKLDNGNWETLTENFYKGGIEQYSLNYGSVDLTPDNATDDSFSWAVTGLTLFNNLGGRLISYAVKGLKGTLSSADIAAIRAAYDATADPVTGEKNASVDNIPGLSGVTVTVKNVFFTTGELMQGSDYVMGKLNALGADMGAIAVAPDAAGDEKSSVVIGQDAQHKDITKTLNGLTKEQIKEVLKESGDYAIKLMITQALEGGATPGSNAVAVMVAANVKDGGFTATTANTSFLNNWTDFKDAMLNNKFNSTENPHANLAGMKDWTNADWQALFDKVIDRYQHPDNYTSAGVFEINGKKVRFTDEAGGFDIQVGVAGASVNGHAGSTVWHPVRHFVTAQADENTITTTDKISYAGKGYYVSQWTILSGRNANQAGSNLVQPSANIESNSTGIDWGDGSTVLYGDPNVVATIGSYDAKTDTFSATVTSWQDSVTGKWITGKLTVTIDLSRIADKAERDRIRQAFIDNASKAIAFYGIGDSVVDGQTFYILGTGTSNE